jgi:hypothetical protein
MHSLLTLIAADPNYSKNFADWILLIMFLLMVVWYGDRDYVAVDHGVTFDCEMYGDGWLGIDSVNANYLQLSF